MEYEMSTERIKEKVLNVVKEVVHINPEDIRDDVLLQDMGIDSLDKTTILMEIEEAFDLEFDESINMNELSFNQIVNLIDTELKDLKID